MKELGAHRYIVNEDLSVNAWWITDSEDTPPWLYQPDHPDGTPWASAEQAEQWFIDWYGPQAPAEEPVE